MRRSCPSAGESGLGFSGTRWFVQLHLELPNEMPLSQVHELCEQVETTIQAEFPQAEVLVHPDPQSVLPASA